MTTFHQHLLNQAGDLWGKILTHPFLKMTADGSIPDDTFKTWMQQDYLFVREAIPFIAVLISKAPVELRSNLTQVLPALDKELDLFRKNAEEHGVNLENVRPAPTCHAYLQFLMATAYGRPFEDGFTVLYAAEKVYLDSWMEVKNNLNIASPWESFIDNWTSEAFQQYVGWLGTTLDDLAKQRPDRDLQRMTDLFLTTARYEYLFWEMAASGETWPI
ncbi:hypothetical protein GWO43_18110 [candidate division KSB1 bacterium]|nr:hypothetical protein [candidate division KSB1 bacterium]NIR69974.1 hypothetical protein [candidate division KSB1 bacterium]NIS25874.1 hypothetical protein [candidate division KSB1 bacterium]NIT72750.1 hypothetical protein [candidate division KSB1 bacterium]NIU26562.1 hypothetical protein [candidate division KSB1 bacterium]